VPAGLDRLVAHLAQGVDIRLGQEVRQISNRPDGVTVTTAGGQVFQAQRLCCTVPLGVLQRGAIRFEPPLPKAKAQAIAQLGMGVLDKIVLLFGERFWGPQTWIRNNSNEPGLWAEWVDLSAVIGRPALMGFNAAGVARDWARRSDDGIVASALAQLRRCYPQATIAAPLEVWLTRWGDDPYAFGSYSFPAVGPVPATALRQELGRRWWSLVLAGEATSTACPATLQGAYLSGRAAAERLLA
jgi:monoamine oxidase